MNRKSSLMAAAFASLVLAGATVPQIAQAGAAERMYYQQCLAESPLKPNERLARSECMWKHWSYMASYGP